ncbi:MAG: putative lipid II flippase MurJ [Chloroflexus sp.]|uniref:murein biosynthesis integral membrane protein MurJ n=1 Tax=Chloroflexus sp. TaxID=1904827 RepID=UPI0021DCF19A|nr:murein biosynthesis integral membrane protein MurJ [Chloroflexus sp.]GIV87826.1 MAG: putative lipid II flippase MurJ [Chloroflexus sp.]
MQLSTVHRRLRTQRNSLIVMGGFILSRITGLIRDIVASYYFGTSAEMAAYGAAISTVDLLYLVIIGGALGSSFIPVFIELWERERPERAWELASAVVTWALIILFVASIILFGAAPWLVPLLYGGQGFTSATLDLIVAMTRLFLLSPLLLGLGGLAMAALNARDRFTMPALAPSIYNLGITGGALLAPWVGIWGMAWGVIIGALCYLLIQLPALFELGMKLRPQLGRNMAELRKVAQAMGPRVIGQAAAHLSMVATLALAARLPDGDAKLAGLRWAYQLMLLPYGVFALSLSTVAFPRLARLVAEQQLSELINDVRTTLSRILWLTLPATAALLTLGPALARVLFERGAFDTLSLSYTAAALTGYAFALPAFAASEIMIRTFYAMQRTWPPVLIGLGQVTLNIGLGTVLLFAGADIGGLAIAFSIANTLETVLLAIVLARTLPGIWETPRVWQHFMSALSASLLVGGLWWYARDLIPGGTPAASYRWPNDVPGLLIGLTITGIGGAALYIVLTLLMNRYTTRTAS